MNILNRVPGSYLWLLSDTEEFYQNILLEARKRGIKSNRIIFAKRCSREDHLYRLQSADLALDTSIVNGAATTSEALWAGVPPLPRGQERSRSVERARPPAEHQPASGSGVLS